jgi:excisionase family DNA binding protein
MEQLLSLRQVSERLGLGIGTIRTYLAEQKLKKVSLSKRSIRIRESELNRFIESSSEPARKAN